MQKLKILALNGLAWAWGLLCLLVGVVDFFQGEFILGALVIVGALLILPPFRKKIPLKPKNITIVAILMTFVPLAILGNKKAIEQQAQKPQETKQEPIQTNNNETENQTIQTPPKPEPKKQEVVKKAELTQSTRDYSKIIMPYSKSWTPKLYSAWGADWINKINKMMPKVVDKVAKNPRCDEPEVVELSDNRSIVKKEAVFFVDCKNKERFYVSQKELTSNQNAKPESEKLGEPHLYIQQCVDAIKAKTNYPSTFDEHRFSIRAYKGTSGNIVIDVPFTAKNGIGVEMESRARCVIDTQNRLIVEM